MSAEYRKWWTPCTMYSKQPESDGAGGTTQEWSPAFEFDCYVGVDSSGEGKVAAAISGKTTYKCETDRGTPVARGDHFTWSGKILRVNMAPDPSEAGAEIKAQWFTAELVDKFPE